MDDDNFVEMDKITISLPDGFKHALEDYREKMALQYPQIGYFSPKELIRRMLHEMLLLQGYDYQNGRADFYHDETQMRMWYDESHKFKSFTRVRYTSEGTKITRQKAEAVK